MALQPAWRSSGKERDRMNDKGALEERIVQWRSYIRRRQALQAVDIDELEDHLRSQVEALGEAGLDEGEAFLVAVKRLGALDSLSREFAREYSERLWKQLVASPGGGSGSSAFSRGAKLAIGLGAAAAITVKLPELFGLHLTDKAAGSFYLRNLTLFVLPYLAAFFAWKRSLRRSAWLWSMAPFAAAGLVMNLMPFWERGHTEALAALHLPIALWCSVGFAYVGGRWRDPRQRMNFVRFSGEWFIYYVLIALGGGVLMGLTAFLFQAIGMDAEALVGSWVLPCGAAGAVVVGAWLVEFKQSVIENMAPVLTRLFTPLFVLLLLLFVATMLWTGNALDLGRELLIGFDLLLALVLALLLYSISARDPETPPGLFDRLQLVMVLCALLVDAMALWAISARIAEFGFSPNKVAALGENLILLVNLGGSALLCARFLAGHGAFSLLERWQTSYIPVYAIWAWIVTAVFPIIFRFK